MARPASPEASACARIWAVDRETGASQRLGSLPALRVACRYSPVGFDRQHIIFFINMEYIKDKYYINEYLYASGVHTHLEYQYKSIIEMKRKIGKRKKNDL